jgi:hypothetical protein
MLMARYREQFGNIVDQVVNVEKRVSKKERAPQLLNSTVSRGQDLSIKGRIRVYGSNGEVIGDLGMSDDGLFTLRIFRSDGPMVDPNDPNTLFGTEIIKLWIPFTEAGISANMWWMDRFGAVILADDSGLGNLLAEPRIPWTYMKTSTFFTPDVTTTSATYTSVWVLTTERANPQVKVCVFVKCSDGSTGGNIRLVDTGLGATGVLEEQTIPVGMNTYATLSGPLPLSSPGNFSRVEIEVKRTAGAGTIGTQIAYAVGWGQA